MEDFYNLNGKYIYSEGDNHEKEYVFSFNKPSYIYYSIKCPCRWPHREWKQSHLSASGLRANVDISVFYVFIM